MAPKRKLQNTTKKMKIMGTRKVQDLQTGEVYDTFYSEVEERDCNFMKLFIGHIAVALDMIGNQKMKVVMWLIENMTRDNFILDSQRSIAKKCGVSYPTVNETMRLLQEAGFLTKKGKGYMVNPNCIFQGGTSKRMALTILYKQAQAEEEQKQKQKQKENGFAVIEGGKSE